jgi:hypothetical protein
MTTLTIELPDNVAEEIRTRNISPQRLERVLVHLVEAYLKESEPATTTSQPSWSDGKEFAERIIAKNRKLFEELARLP